MNLKTQRTLTIVLLGLGLIAGVFQTALQIRNDYLRSHLMERLESKKSDFDKTIELSNCR